MDNQINIFNFVFDNDELQHDFIDFFISNGLLPLFGYENKAHNNLRVTESEALSVVNEGAYGKDLLTFANLVLTIKDNLMFDDSLFKVLDNSTSFQRMMNLVRKINQRYVETVENRKFNYWNIVFYSKNIF